MTFRRLSAVVHQAVDIQTGDEDEDLESPTLLLEALEDQELDIAKKYFKNFIEDKLPLGSVRMTAWRHDVIV